jgi:hypothetical protein
MFRNAVTPYTGRGSSVSIVSDYGLHDRAIGVRSPVGAKDFSSNLCVQTGSEAHPASCTMDTGGSFPGTKARPGRDADHSPHLVPKSRMSRSYTSSLPPSSTMACSGMALFFVAPYVINQLLDIRKYRYLINVVSIWPNWLWEIELKP